MVANKVPGVRAANAHDTSMARNAREHNHANVLTLGARMIGEGLALEIVDAFLATPWGAERHGEARREDHADRAAVPHRQRRGTPPMTAPPDDRAQLIEAITRQVMATLAGAAGPGDGSATGACANCSGGCAARCATRVARGGRGRRLARHLHGRGGPRPRRPRALHRPHAAAAGRDGTPTSTGCAPRPSSTASRACASTPPGSRAPRPTCKGTGVPVASVIGFPFGATLPEIKAHEARSVIRDGRPRDRHGHQHRRAQERDAGRGPRRHRGGRATRATSRAP